MSDIGPSERSWSKSIKYDVEVTQGDGEACNTVYLFFPVFIHTDEKKQTTSSYHEPSYHADVYPPIY